MISILILFLFLTKCEPSLRFSDEFNEKDFIDENKWKVEHEVKDCNGNYINQLNCKTDDKNNLRVIDGTLALAAIRHKHANKFYTSPMITTKQSFKYGRFEMRAALPNAKMLRPVISLIPTAYTGEWPTDGQIDILTYNQTKSIEYGIHFEYEQEKIYLGKSSEVKENPNDFQNYILEWNESSITWYLNDHNLFSMDLSKKFSNAYKPFDKEFKLTMSLGIGGYYKSNVGSVDYFPEQILTEKDVKEWKCSLLIFDYIRVYDIGSKPQTTGGLQNVPSSQICNKVMPLIRPKKTNWKMIFSDEFNGKEYIDQNIWDVTHETDYCDGNQLQQLHCKTNSSSNIRQMDGTLVLAAIREKYSKNDFTAPFITSKTNFTFGRFEIRAVLPDGKMLRPSVFLKPTERHNQQLKDVEVWSRDGLIEFFSNTQINEIYYGIHFALNGKYERKGGESHPSQTTRSLHQFHTYAMEWTETEFRWFLDDTHHLKTYSIQHELKNNYNPFDKPFKLVMSLGVGGDFKHFKNKQLSLQDADQWKCPLFILDYVRVYEATHETILTNKSDQNKVTSSEICSKVVPLIRKGLKREPEPKISIIAIISITSFLLLLAIIPLIFFLFFRNKSSRNASDYIEPNKQMYDMDMDMYDEVIPTNNYSEAYDNPNHNCFQTEYENLDQIEDNSGNYLKMTNKYIEK